MKEKEYTIEELVNDRSFIAWALNPNDARNEGGEEWLRLYPKNPALVKEAQLIVKNMYSLKVSYPDQAKEKLWERIKLSNLERELNSVKEIHSNPRAFSTHRPINKRIVVGLCAAAAIAVFFIVRFSFQKPTNETAQPVVSEITKSNPAGQKSQIHLPDGSTVYLNAESELRYSENFGSGKREVFLKGEAFFEVVRDPNSPFSVQTGQLTTTVLGTSFNVSSFVPENHIEIALVSGKVQIRNNEDKKSINLLPGENAILDKTQGSLVKGTFDTNKMALWKDGVIYFDKTDFKEAIKTLERWYNVDIHVKALPHKTLTCSGQFKNEYLNNVLNNLGFSLGFKYEIQQKNVTINFNR